METESEGEQSPSCLRKVLLTKSHLPALAREPAGCMDRHSPSPVISSPATRRSPGEAAVKVLLGSGCRSAAGADSYEDQPGCDSALLALLSPQPPSLEQGPALGPQGGTCTAGPWRKGWLSTHLSKWPLHTSVSTDHIKLRWNAHFLTVEPARSPELMRCCLAVCVVTPQARTSEFSLHGVLESKRGHQSPVCSLLKPFGPVCWVWVLVPFYSTIHASSLACATAAAVCLTSGCAKPPLLVFKTRF